MLFTSGTTGEPKGVLHSQNTLYAGVLAEIDVFGLDDSLVVLTTSSYTHYVGFVQGMLLPIHLGGTAVFQDTGEGHAVVDLVAEHDVTFLYSAPAFLRGVLDAQSERPRDTAALRVLVSGSAPILPQFVDEVRKAFGVRLHSLFGMTENGPVTISRLEDPDDWAARSDGHPTPGTEVRIEELPEQPDGGGVLWVRGPTQCLGYDRREDVYAASVDADGWFTTGDIARPDGRGGIRIAGRARDMILRQSFVVPVSDLEALTAELPKVREATVVGYPDGLGDEVICAIVTCYDAPVTLDELQEHLRTAGMTKTYWPTRLEIRDELPKTAMGKVRKTELRAELMAG
ncbi:AMP-binding protein [Fodinicola feengrottensis]|uniref:AMP-binding protein n=1 Tax=Fodinicola feengrottensis TaxID=435914 RepID=UPI0024428702|nr:AMP-binding protein [Fodinicola feengrottensis]